MRKFTSVLVAMALSLVFLSFVVTPARGSAPDLSPANRPQLSAVSIPGGVELSWTDPNPQGVTGYLVRRGPAPGKEDRWPLTDFPVVGTRFTDRNVVPGDTYYYVVIPLMQGGTMGRTSSEASAEAGVVPAGYKLITLGLAQSAATVLTSEGVTEQVLTAQPIYERGRMMLTLEDARALLGAVIVYDRETGKVIHKLPSGREMELEVGKCCLTFVQAVKPDSCAPVIRGERLFLPLRWIAEAMEGTVSFDTLSQTAVIEMPPVR